MKIINNQIINTTVISALIYLVLMNSGNFLSWLYQILLTKYLTKEEVSIYFSLIAFVSILISPFGTLNLYLQEKINFYKKNNQKYINEIIFKVVIFLIYSSIFILIVLIIFKNLIIYKFSHNNLYTYINFSLVFLISIFLIVPTSVLNAYKKYSIPGYVYIITDLIKLLLGYYLFKYSSLNNFNIAININLFFVFFLLLGNSLYARYSLFKEIKISKKNIRFYSQENLIKLIKFMSYSVCIPIIMNLDILIVKFAFSNIESADYILASTLSKISFFFSSSLFAIIYNENIIKKFNIEQDYSKILTILSILISLLITMILLFSSKKIILFIYDDRYLASVKIIYFLAPSLFLTSFLNIICNNLISKNNFSFIIYFLFYAILFTILVNYFSKDLIDVALYQLICTTFLLTLVSIPYFKKKIV